MGDTLRIGVHIGALIVSAYVLVGVDFTKILKAGHRDKAQLLYVVLTLALAHLVAQFLLSLSMNFVY